MSRRKKLCIRSFFQFSLAILTLHQSANSQTQHTLPPLDETADATRALQQPNLTVSPRQSKKKQKTSTTSIPSAAPFFLEDDGATMIWGDKASAFREAQRTVTLLHGKLIVIVGSEPLIIKASIDKLEFQAKLPSNCICQTALTAHAFSCCNLNGAPITLSLPGNQSSELACGEEIIIEKEEEMDGEGDLSLLHPGVDRKLISSQIGLAGTCKGTRWQFDTKMMVVKDLLFHHNLGTFYGAEAKRRAAIEKIYAAPCASPLQHP